MNDVIIRTERLSKVYGNGYRTAAIEDIDLSVERRSFSCIMGPSGHGKSTLLHLLGGLDRPTGNLDSKSEAELLDLIGTHSDTVARRAERIIRIRDGRVVSPA